MGQDVPNEKALFREAKAFYSLGKFKPCMEKLLVLVRYNPKTRRRGRRSNESDSGSVRRRQDGISSIACTGKL